jgi:hypothetical protein
MAAYRARIGPRFEFVNRYPVRHYQFGFVGDEFGVAKARGGARRSSDGQELLVCVCEKKAAVGRSSSAAKGG